MNAVRQAKSISIPSGLRGDKCPITPTYRTYCNRINTPAHQSVVRSPARAGIIAAWNGHMLPLLTGSSQLLPAPCDHGGTPASRAGRLVQLVPNPPLSSVGSDDRG